MSKRTCLSVINFEDISENIITKIIVLNRIAKMNKQCISMLIEHKRSFNLLEHLQLIATIHLLLLILCSLIFLSSSTVVLCIICNINTFVMLIDSLMICDDCIKVNNDVMIEENVEKELICLT